MILVIKAIWSQKISWKSKKDLITSKTTTTFSPQKNALGARCFIVHKVPPAKMAKFTKTRGNWRQTMDHSALGK